MKQVSKMIGSALVVAAAFAATHASANGVVHPFAYDNNAQFQGNDTYIGTLSPTFYNSATFGNGSFNAGVFTDYWTFDISPAGNNSASLTFQPPTGVTGFAISLYKTTAMGVCALTGLNTAAQCTTQPTIGALVPTSNSSIGNFTSYATTSFLAAGRYVVEVTGTALINVAGANSYGGSIAVNPLPEPGSLALVGIGLLGAAVSLRKRKSS